jgi:hypothetical protein
MVMAADVDLRTTYQASTSSPAYPSEGVYKNVIMSCKVDVPALIAAGVLNSTDGLVYTSGTYKYKLFSLPKNTIVRGGWILVRTVEATGPTGTITIYLNTTVFSGTHALTGLGVIMSAGYGEASGITVPTAWNTGGGQIMSPSCFSRQVSIRRSSMFVSIVSLGNRLTTLGLLPDPQVNKP